jgi:hypothetical protein
MSHNHAKPMVTITMTMKMAYSIIGALCYTDRVCNPPQPEPKLFRQVTRRSRSITTFFTSLASDLMISLMVKTPRRLMNAYADAIPNCLY